MTYMLRSLKFTAALLAGSLVIAQASAGTVSVSRSGPNGGHWDRTTACRGGVHYGGCATGWSYTGPQGRTWSGRRAAGYGPRGGAGYRSVTGPRGNTIHRGAGWRRW